MLRSKDSYVTEIGLPGDLIDYANRPIEYYVATPTVDSRLLRALDVIFALVGLLFVAPLLIVLMGAVWRQDGAAPLYSQWRLGRNGQLFRCYKIRSMVSGADAKLQEVLASDPSARQEWDLTRKLRNDPRVTRLGRFLRKSSLDELPQLFNVLRGDMSLVGPRPILRDEASRYGRWIAHYFAVRPGLTGLWQINGRNQTTYRRRVALDVTYVRRRSLGLNLAILARTVPCVLLQRGC
jgi:exopolysaccharide production protein ExoY